MKPAKGNEVEAALAAARTLVLRHGRNATAYQILNPGLDLWFSEEPEGVVGYVETKGRRVVAGEPIASPEAVLDLADRFEAESASQGLAVCYFGAEAPLASEPTADRLLLGAQPTWSPDDWPTILAERSSLRAQLARAHNKGVVVEAWSTERATKNPELERCLEEWLQSRGLPPMHFLVEPETLGRLFDRRVFVAGNDHGVLGFLVASPARGRRGWLIEQIVRGRAAPNGTAEVLIDSALRHLAADGATYVTLGLSPLSQRCGIEEPPRRWWIRFLLGWVRAHGQRFYDFDGLDFFKAKLQPATWEPIYAVTRGRTLGLGDLYAIGAAFSGGSPWGFLARGLARAVRREARNLITWLRPRDH